MVYFFEAIRVQHSNFRRDVPELKNAVKALDEGKCVVIFPEGRLRRTEEQPLRLFGQGVWHILSERPETLVVVCWIEGGWGSYVSYFNGPPAKNKPFDIAHPISISIGEPHMVDPEILRDDLTTRFYLMEECGQLRKYLGLPAIELQQMEKEAVDTSIEVVPNTDKTL
jgi:1-acyl-sn-glycerol-3-phosphate acyltransferase